MNAKAVQTSGKRTTDAPKEAVETAAKDVKPFMAFMKKFGNDWTMNLSAALAYNLLMAIFPIAVAVLAILGFVLGSLSLDTYNMVKAQITGILPPGASSGIIDSVTLQLKKASGLL
ncbi:MAG TPA: hypothetical protein VGN15_08605, partial [Ktedonobacteraceae bacterium]|nr:hypothetical protein [Ktedonobacteraceae bacterium]